MIEYKVPCSICKHEISTTATTEEEIKALQKQVGQVWVCHNCSQPSWCACE